MKSNCITANKESNGIPACLPSAAKLFLDQPRHHRAYGLTFSSDVFFPQWPVATDIQAIDVSIRQGVIFGDPYTPPQSMLIESSPERLLLRGSKSANILVAAGKAITLEPLPSGSPAVIRQILLGWALAGIFHQRKMLPLHGSVLNNNDGSFILCGTSGTGKSTLTTAFLNAGYSYLDDNIALITFSDTLPLTQPGIPEIRLWEEVINQIDFEYSLGDRVKPDTKKFSIQAASNFRSKPALLKKIFILRRTREAHLSMVELNGAAKFQVLGEHVFCLHLMKNSADRISLFENLKILAAAVPVMEIRLPTPLPPPEKVKEFIMDVYLRSISQRRSL